MEPAPFRPWNVLRRRKVTERYLGRPWRLNPLFGSATPILRHTPLFADFRLGTLRDGWFVLRPVVGEEASCRRSPTSRFSSRRPEPTVGASSRASSVTYANAVRGRCTSSHTDWNHLRPGG